MSQINYRQRLRDRGRLPVPGATDLSFQPSAVTERVTIAQQNEMATRSLRQAEDVPEPFVEETPAVAPVAPPPAPAKVRSSPPPVVAAPPIMPVVAPAPAPPATTDVDTDAYQPPDEDA